MERVAFAKTEEGESEALKNAVFFYSFQGIIGAGREKTAAVAHKRADGRLIEPQ